MAIAVLFVSSGGWNGSLEALALHPSPLRYHHFSHFATEPRGFPNHAYLRNVSGQATFLQEIMQPDPGLGALIPQGGRQSVPAWRMIVLESLSTPLGRAANCEDALCHSYESGAALLWECFGRGPSGHWLSADLHGLA